MLWDAFFALISSPNYGFTLIDVLEYAAASMILLQKSRLLENCNGNDVANDAIQILMNYPPMSNIGLFLSELRRLMFTAAPQYKKKRSTQIKPSQSQQQQQMQQAVQQTFSNMQNSFGKALDSFGGQCRVLVRDVEKGYRAAVQHSATVTKNLMQEQEARASGSNVMQMKVNLERSVSILREYLQDCCEERGKDVVPKDVWEAVLKIEEVKNGLENLKRA